MSNWVILIHISSDERENVELPYSYDEDLTYRQLNRDLFNYLSFYMSRIIRQYNLIFDDYNESPSNWYLTDSQGNRFNLDDNINPSNMELYLNIIERYEPHYNAPSRAPEYEPVNRPSRAAEYEPVNAPLRAAEYEPVIEQSREPDHVPEYASEFAPLPAPSPPYVPLAFSKHESHRVDWDPRSVIGRFRKDEYISPEELRAYRDMVNKFDEEQIEKWKDRYIKKLIGNTGIGISCEYYFLEALLKDNNYFTVIHLTQTGAAKKAGILVGDKIIYVDGVACKNNYEFKYYLLGEPSSEIVLDLIRDGQLMKFKFNRNPTRDSSENAELPTTLGGYRKRLSKKGQINRKRLSKKDR